MHVLCASLRGCISSCTRVLWLSSVTFNVLHHCLSFCGCGTFSLSSFYQNLFCASCWGLWICCVRWCRCVMPFQLKNFLCALICGCGPIINFVLIGCWGVSVEGWVSSCSLVSCVGVVSVLNCMQPGYLWFCWHNVCVFSSCQVVLLMFYIVGMVPVKFLFYLWVWSQWSTYIPFCCMYFVPVGLLW